MRRIATCHCGARRFRRRPTTTGDGGRRSSGDSCRWSRAWDVPPHGCSIEDSMRSSSCECFSLLGWSGSCGSCKRGRSSWVTAKSLARGSSPATFESRTRPRCRTSTRGRTECGCIRCPSGTRRCVCSTLKGASGSSSSPVFAMKTWCCSRTLALTTGTTQNGSCLPTCAAGDAKRARGFGSNRRTSRTSAYATTIRSGVSRCSRCSRTESKPCGFCAIPRSPASSSRASRSSSRTCPFFITVCGRASRTRCSRGPDVAGRPHAPFSQSVLDLAGVAGDRVGLITTSPRFSTGWGLLSPAHASRHTPNSLSGGGVHAAARKGNSSLSGDDDFATDRVTGECTAPQYTVKSYKAGDQVQNKGVVYQCKPYPYSGWCGIAGAYEPGVGSAWQDAWTSLGACGSTGGSSTTGSGGSSGSTSSGSSGSTTTGGTCNFPQWAAGNNYVTGNIVMYNGKPYIATHDNPGYDPTISTWFWSSYTGCSGGTGGSTGSGGSTGGTTGTSKLDVRAGSVPDQYLPWLRKAADMCPFLDAPHLAAQIDQESRWDPNAVSWLGAQGLSQFLPGTWATFGVDANNDGSANPFDPADAIMAQGKYMCYLVSQFGSGLTWTTLLWAYNAGPEATKAAGGRAPTQEAADYAFLIQNQLLPKYKP